MGYSKQSMQAIWFGFGLVCFLVFVIVITTQLQEPKAEIPQEAAQQNTPPVMNAPLKFDVINDVDNAPIRRMLKVMLPHRVTLTQLKVLSHQIKNALPNQDYKYIVISYQIPEMPVSHGVWGKAEFKYAQNEEIKIHGFDIPKLKAFLRAPSPQAEQILGDWLIEEPYGSRRAVITKDQEKYFYHIQWSPTSEFTTHELAKPDNHGRFVYLDGSDDAVHSIRQNGDLELSSEDGVFAVGHPRNSYQIPAE